MKDKMRMLANISAVLSGIGARQNIRRSGHDDIHMQAGYDTQQQAGHEAIQVVHYAQQSRHNPQPIIADNVPAGTNDAANFWTGYVSRYPGGTRPGNQSRYELYIGFLHEKWGWNVEYNRIIPGEDRIRRGLICSKEDKVRVVHCLFRPANDIIHAGFIYLLFAMAWEFKHDWPNLKVSARFFTPATLDIKARQAANKFSVKASEHFPFKDFPYVKCITGQRIYYTPYDNEYFTANATKRLWTIQQAQAQGFIHGV